jgi:O-antigen ligase
VVLAIVGGIVGWLLEVALVALGQPLAVPPITLALALLAIGIIVMFMARPVRRAARDRVNHTVDPFYATRVLVLAKASSITGSLVGGACLAIVVYLLTRSVLGGVGSIFTASGATIGAIVLVIGGLVAEYMCSIPPEDDDKGDSNPATTRPL